MYKIPKPFFCEVWSYYIQYKDVVLNKIREVLAPEFELVCTIRNRTYKFIVKEASPLRCMLEYLLNGNHLFILFGSDVEGMLYLIRFMEFLYPDFREGPSMKKYGKLAQIEAVEDPNVIFKYILVDSVFEKKEKGKPILKKIDFVNNKNLHVCPYCGALGIKIIKRTHGNKRNAFVPYLDHYFPKSKYPFLALNYYNLIPCCHDCNTSTNKGNYDPYADKIERMSLMNPYEFNEDSFRFYFVYDCSGQYEPENFTSHIDYGENIHLKDGYTRGIAIEDLYINDVEMRNIWTMVQGRCSKGYSVLLQSTLEISQDEIDILISPDQINRFLIDYSVSSLFGYEWSEVESRRQLKYKFKKDILNQMIRLVGFNVR